MKELTLSNKVIMVIVSFILGLWANYLFFDKSIGISFPIMVLTFIIGFIFINYRNNIKLSTTQYFLLACALFFSAMVAVWDSMILTFLNVFASLILLSLVSETGLIKKIYSLNLGNYIRAWTIDPMLYFLEAFTSLPNLLKAFYNINQSETQRKVIKGVLMAVPAALVLIILLAQADQIFAQFIKNLIFIDITGRFIAQLVIVILITIFLIGFFSYFYKRVNIEETISETKPEGKHSLSAIELNVFLGILNAILISFIVIQITYLFGGKTNISVAGFTYAEYARRGFFELVIASCLTGLILFFAHKSYKKTGGIKDIVYLIFNSLLIAQILVILYSAYFKLSLYQEAYGLTHLRFYTTAFLPFIGIALLLVLLYVFKTHSAKILLGRLFILLIIWFAAINLIGPERIIAKTNFDRYLNTGKIDLGYMYSLSADAFPYLYNLRDKNITASNIENSQYLINDQGQYLSVSEQLDNKVKNLKQDNKWMEWKWSKQKAISTFK